MLIRRSMPLVAAPLDHFVKRSKARVGSFFISTFLSSLCLAGIQPGVAEAQGCPTVFDLKGSSLHSDQNALYGDRLGLRIARAGDVDGDGVNDLAATSYRDTHALDGAYGENVKLFSGRTGLQLAKVSSPNALTSFGRGIASLGDIDGDSRGEIAVTIEEPFGGGAPGRVQLFGFSPTRLLGELVGIAGDEFAGAMIAPGDLDGDGISDLVVSARGRSVGESSSSYVYGAVDIYSGRTRQRIATLANPSADWEQPIYQFGTDLASLGDIDADGIADFAVLDPFSDDGSAVIVSGASAGRGEPQILAILIGDENFSSLGTTAAALGDINGNGRNEFMLVAADSFSPENRVAVIVLEWNGTAMELRYLVRGTSADFTGFGSSVSGVGDISGDGITDFAVAAASSSGSAYVAFYSGVDGHELSRIKDTATAGSNLVNLGDLNGDGAVELAISDSLDTRGNDLTRVNSNTVFHDPEAGAVVVRTVGVDRNSNATPDACERLTSAPSVVDFATSYEALTKSLRVNLRMRDVATGLGVALPSNCKFTLQTAVSQSRRKAKFSKIRRVVARSASLDLMIRGLPMVNSTKLGKKKLFFKTGLECGNKPVAMTIRQIGEITAPTTRRGGITPGEWLRRLEKGLAP